MIRQNEEFDQTGRERFSIPERLRCVVFDLDGTLVDSHRDIESSIKTVLRSHGYDRLDGIDVPRLIGDGSLQLVHRAMVIVEAPIELLDSYHEQYLAEYGRQHLNETLLYPGVESTLRLLDEKGIKMSVVTNKPKGFSVSLLDHLGVADHFCSVIGGDSLEVRKPDPEPILAALRECGVDPSEAVMVGDGDTDMRAGRAAGLPTVGVTYGFRDERSLLAAGAMVTIGAFTDLAHVLGVGLSQTV